MHNDAFWCPFVRNNVQMRIVLQVFSLAAEFFCLFKRPRKKNKEQNLKNKSKESFASISDTLVTTKTKTQCTKPYKLHEKVCMRHTKREMPKHKEASRTCYHVWLVFHLAI